jgi:hypothetical protein
MPCYTPTPQQNFEYAMDSLQEANRLLEYYRSMSDEATRLLCKICQYGEDQGLIDSWGPDFRKWWNHHKLFDKEKESQCQK